MNKQETADKIQFLLENDSIESIMQLLYNFYSSKELKDLYEFIKEEKGI